MAQLLCSSISNRQSDLSPLTSATNPALIIHFSSTKLMRWSVANHRLLRRLTSALPLFTLYCIYCISCSSLISLNVVDQPSQKSSYVTADGTTDRLGNQMFVHATVLGVAEATGRIPLL